MRQKGLVWYCAAVLLASMTAVFVVFENQRSGFYNAEADSIGIPIFSTVITFLFLMFLLLLQIPLLLQKKKGVHKPVFAVVFSAFSTVCTLIVVVGSLLYWFASGHFIIFVSYLFALVVYAWFQAGLYRGVWVAT